MRGVHVGGDVRPSRRSVLGLAALGVAGLAGCGAAGEPGGAAATGAAAGTSGSTGTPSTPTTSATTAPTTTARRPATAAQMLARATVPVLCYHQVRAYEGGDSAYTRGNLVIPPRALAAQLDAIAAAGYTTITPDTYWRHLQTGTGLPAKPVMLTFDDGKDNQALAGLPLLAERKMTATFFVMTVVIGNPGWMTKADVRRVADAGMTIGSHTWDHHMVTTYTGDDWKTQFDKPRATLRALSGQDVLDLAYPYGAWNAAAFTPLKAAGYRAAYQLREDPIAPAAPQYTLRRILAASDRTGAQVVADLAAF